MFDQTTYRRPLPQGVQLEQLVENAFRDGGYLAERSSILDTKYAVDFLVTKCLRLYLPMPRQITVQITCKVNDTAKFLNFAKKAKSLQPNAARVYVEVKEENRKLHFHRFPFIAALDRILSDTALQEDNLYRVYIDGFFSSFQVIHSLSDFKNTVIPTSRRGGRGTSRRRASSGTDDDFESRDSRDSRGGRGRTAKKKRSSSSSRDGSGTSGRDRDSDDRNSRSSSDEDRPSRGRGRGRGSSRSDRDDNRDDRDNRDNNERSERGRRGGRGRSDSDGSSTKDAEPTRGRSRRGSSDDSSPREEDSARRGRSRRPESDDRSTRDDDAPRRGRGRGRGRSDGPREDVDKPEAKDATPTKTEDRSRSGGRDQDRNRDSRSKDAAPRHSARPIPRKEGDEPKPRRKPAEKLERSPLDAPPPADRGPSHPEPTWSEDEWGDWDEGDSANSKPSGRKPRGKEQSDSKSNDRGGRGRRGRSRDDADAAPKTDAAPEPSPRGRSTSKDDDAKSDVKEKTSKKSSRSRRSRKDRDSSASDDPFDWENQPEPDESAVLEDIKARREAAAKKESEPKDDEETKADSGRRGRKKRARRGSRRDDDDSDGFDLFGEAETETKKAPARKKSKAAAKKSSDSDAADASDDGDRQTAVLKSWQRTPGQSAKEFGIAFDNDGNEYYCHQRSFADRNNLAKLRAHVDEHADGDEDVTVDVPISFRPGRRKRPDGRFSALEVTAEIA